MPRCRRPAVQGVAAAAVIGGVLLVGGCYGERPGDFGTPGLRPPVASAVTVGNADSGKTVRVKIGQDLQVVLTGGYWTFKGSSAPIVLKQDGAPIQLPRSPANCPPGLGCTPLELRFTALAPGTAVVRAGRTTCGEALRCTGERGRFSVTVVVDR